MRGLVKAIELFDLRQPRLIHALAAPVSERAAFGRAARRLGLGQVLLHRPARHELQNDESQQQHAQQRGQHQQQAFGNVGRHGKADGPPQRQALNPSRP